MLPPGRPLWVICSDTYCNTRFISSGCNGTGSPPPRPEPAEVVLVYDTGTGGTGRWPFPLDGCGGCEFDGPAPAGRLPDGIYPAGAVPAAKIPPFRSDAGVYEFAPEFELYAELAGGGRYGLTEGETTDPVP